MDTTNTNTETYNRDAYHDAALHIVDVLSAIRAAGDWAKLTSAMHSFDAKMINQQLDIYDHQRELRSELLNR